jgi:hypothetical protein
MNIQFYILKKGTGKPGGRNRPRPKKRKKRKDSQIQTKNLESLRALFLLAFRCLWCCSEDSSDGGPDLFFFPPPHRHHFSGPAFVICSLPIAVFCFCFISISPFLPYFLQHHMRILLAPTAAFLSASPTHSSRYNSYSTITIQKELFDS